MYVRKKRTLNPSFEIFIEIGDEVGETDSFGWHFRFCLDGGSATPAASQRAIRAGIPRYVGRQDALLASPTDRNLHGHFQVRRRRPSALTTGLGRHLFGAACRLARQR